MRWKQSHAADRAMPLLFILLLFALPARSDAALPSLISAAQSDTIVMAETDGSAEVPLEEPIESGWADDAVSTSFFSKNTLAELQLFIEDSSLRSYWRLEILRMNTGRLFYDLGQAHQRLAGLSGFNSFASLLFSLAQVFIAALLVEILVRFTFLRRKLKRTAAYPLRWSHLLWLALAHAVPKVLSLIVFVVSAYAAYILIYASYFSIICPTFLMTLVTVVIIRVVAIIADLILSPGNAPIRLIDCGDDTAKVGYQSVVTFITILTLGVMSVSILKYGGLKGDSLLLVKLFYGTIFLAATGLMLIWNRTTISGWISDVPQRASEDAKLAVQRSYVWIILAGIYLVTLWLIWSSKLILSESQMTLAFTMSLLLIPIFLILDGLIGWLFNFARETFSSDDKVLDGETDELQDRSSPGVISTYLRTLSRVALIVLLLIWVLHLWHIRFAYTPALIAGIGRVIMIVIIFFVIWQIIDKSIGIYLSRKEEGPDDGDEGGESEWGDGQLLDRSQTLLPIVRKFVGIVMLVLLVLFTLSALGVNIGPLLAGAGVMGIAIGFGAQKLVSDLLSGFFYLVDDAFRVGEYIEAGSVKGTVEKITLRNLMLRHHRGMLQIIPYSDLGSITNYMRGGIVVKFNLQFPYDTDVDLVRKVIKRVGIEMLNDPELGKSFVKQLKSQGIREVGDSVLTIRAKFTANPGSHFLIRREAYRRITESLNEKGIYYAHRKVIVDFPESPPTETVDETAKKKLVQAGAASALALDGANHQKSTETDSRA